MYLWLYRPLMIALHKFISLGIANIIKHLKVRIIFKFREIFEFILFNKQISVN